MKLSYFIIRSTYNVKKRHNPKVYSVPKYVIRFNNEEQPTVPYYCIEETEEWMEVPRKGIFYYDPLEDSSQYQRISGMVDILVGLDRKARKLKGKLGACHYIWNLRKRILKECYGIDWHTPQELNPRCHFD